MVPPKIETVNYYDKENVSPDFDDNLKLLSKSNETAFVQK